MSVCKNRKTQNALIATGYDNVSQSSSDTDRRQMNTITTDNDSSKWSRVYYEEQSFESERHTLFTVQSNNKRRPCPTINVKLGKYTDDLNFGIDTQASLNAISWDQYKLMENPPVLRQSNVKAWSYDGTKPIDCPGMFLSQITANGKVAYAQFFVYHGVKSNLLCWDTCVELGICQENLGMNQINTTDMHLELLNKQKND